MVKDGYLEQLARGLNLSFDSVKKDFSRFTKNRRPRRAYGPSENLSEKESSEWSQRLTSVEDDLLFTLLHDDRLASPLAHALDLAWLIWSPLRGAVFAKILSETVADGPLSVPQMEDLLEDDLERGALFKISLPSIFALTEKIHCSVWPTSASAYYFPANPNATNKIFSPH